MQKNRLSGYSLKEQLELRGCYPELADPEHVLCVFSIASTLRDGERLIEALADINKAAGDSPSSELVCTNAESEVLEGSISEPVSFGWGQEHHHSCEVDMLPVAECAGRRAAEMIVPYSGYSGVVSGREDYETSGGLLGAAYGFRFPVSRV